MLRLSVLRRTIGPSFRRSYSESTPLPRLHAQYQDVEGLFKKHRLHELDSADKIENLVRSGTITEHIGDQLKHDLKVQQEAGKTAEYWRKVFLFVGLPIIGLVAYNTYQLEMKHFEHLEHEPVNQIPYDHLKIRTKKYPWGDGDQTLFHNEKINR